MFLFCAIVLLPKNKVTIAIIEIIRSPGYLLILIGPMIKGTLFIMLTFMLPLAIFNLIFFYGANILNIQITESTLTYLVLISASIFIIEFYEKVLDLIIKWFHIHKEQEKKTFISRFSKSLMNKQRIRFLIYTFYFIYLIPYSIVRLQSNVSHEFLNSVFYSFSTFLAYEKIIQNLDLMKINYKNTIKELVENSIFVKKN